MLTAITRGVSAALKQCELSFLERREIDVERAAAQHREYERTLAELGVSVISLPPEPGLPDAVFVEDPAVIVEDVAVMTRMGAASRRAESQGLAAVLAGFRPIRWIEEPGTVEGGDVLRAGGEIFVGISERTNRSGFEQLAGILAAHDLRTVEVRGCLHLKTAICYLGNGTMLANREWVDMDAFANFRVLEVGEAWGANVLAINGTVLMAEGFPRTRKIVEDAGFPVRTLDISELMKAEAGLTCMSLLFESTAGRPRPF